MQKLYKSLIDDFFNKKVLVIGDAMLDIYIKGIMEGICREAPVPVIQINEQEINCGGAANTAINLAALGANTIFLSVTGADKNGEDLIHTIQNLGVNTDYIIKDSGRKTITKKRIVASSSILLRMDEGCTTAVNVQTQQKIISSLQDLYCQMDAIVLSDYENGIINQSLLDALEKLKKEKDLLLIVDSKKLQKFKKLKPDLVKPNYSEAIGILNIPRLHGIHRVNQIMGYGKNLLEITGAKCVATTLDANGTIVFEPNKPPFRIYSTPKNNQRSIGAGDTFVSAMSLALLSGASPQIAAEIGSSAASVILEKEGTSTCHADDLKYHFNENPKYFDDLADLILAIGNLRKQGKKIVLTNGCFDILNSGHVNFLNQAKTLGDVLVVGINSDESIRKVKGEQRPINSLANRIEVLSALKSVDHLISFNEPTAEGLVEKLLPHFFVKGSTYSLHDIPEAPMVEQVGGEVIIIPSSHNFSTTQLIHQIRTKGCHDYPMLNAVAS